MTDQQRLTRLLTDLLKVAAAADAVVKADRADCARLAAAPGALEDHPELRRLAPGAAWRFFQQADVAELDAALSSVRPLLDVIEVEAGQAGGADAA